MSHRARSRRWLQGALAALTLALLPVSAAHAAARYEEIALPSTQGNIDLSVAKLNNVSSLMATVRLPDGYDANPTKRWPVLFLLQGIGDNSRAWASPGTGNFEALIEEVFQPVVHVPRHPVVLGRFGLDAVQPATWAVRRFQEDPARALFMGVAAHAFGRLDTPLSSSVGLMLTAATHAVGWPVAEGGSESIARALLDLCKRPEAIRGPRGTSIRISRQELARNVGCSREMAGRVLKKLEEDGALVSKGRSIMIFSERSPD